MTKEIDKSLLYKALGLLDARLGQKGIGPHFIVVCGGSGLIAMDLVARTTKDVDMGDVARCLRGIPSDPGLDAESVGL